MDFCLLRTSRLNLQSRRSQRKKDIHSETMIVKRVRERLLVGDTDIGEELKRQVKDLERLLVAYRNGELREKR